MSKQTNPEKEGKKYDVDVKVRNFCGKAKIFFIIRGKMVSSFTRG